MARTAVQLNEMGDLRKAVAFAKRVEELGFEMIWVGEAWGRDAFTILTTLACATERVKLGTGIVNVFSRSPGLIAQSTATLDEVSGGRAVLGLGTSGAAVIEGFHGLPYKRPLQRLKEYVEIVRILLAGERLNYDGELFQINRGFQLRNKPLRASVPIFLASLGERSLRLTGEIADGWLPIYLCPEKLPELTAPMRAGAAAAGRDFDAITISPYIHAAVSSDGEEARGFLRGQVAYYVAGMGSYYRRLIESYGFVEEAAAIAGAWAERDRPRAAALVSDAMLDALTISGTPSQCRARLAQYREQGVQLPTVSLPHGITDAMTRETLEALRPTDRP